ncbi:MAG: efflux RND transporter periplasmic adaptor subunit [Acidobacteriota bacterium]
MTSIRPIVVGIGLLLWLGACGGGERGTEMPEPADAERASPGASGDEHGTDVVELSPEELGAVEIVTGRAERRRLPARLATTGEVDYEQDRIAHVSPRIPGRIDRVPASLGDEVRRGQVLAVLDSVELGRAKAEFLAAKTREELALENYEREKGLHEDRISSEKEMLEARAAHLEAMATRETAEETLHLYGLSDQRVDALEPGSPGASLLEVRAPIGGRVVQKHATLGELARPSESLFTIADLGRVWIWIDVFERDLAAVHRGDEVEVRVESFPERTFEGEVTYLSPEVDPETRTVRARIDVPNPDGLLRPGMFADVRLTDPHVAGVETLVVPQAALVRRGEERLVFEPLDGGRFVARAVETGRRVDGVVEVLSGLEPGDRVVTEGSFFLKSELARAELGGGHHH